MSYTRVTGTERTLIARWLQEGKSIREVSRLLRRAASTVLRELARNTGGRGYRPVQAQERAASRARRTGPRKVTEAILRELAELVGKGWTPEMVAGRAEFEGRPHVSRETGYRLIYEDAKSGGGLWRHLPRAHRKRGRRCPRAEGRGRGRIPGQVPIDLRPAAANSREEAWHWEGDLVNGAGARGYFVTLTERRSRLTIVGWVASKDAAGVRDEVVRLIKSAGFPCASITFDNGKEFALHGEIARALGAVVYFAHPYHSWERGTNENANGLIRRFYPKGCSLEHVTGRELARLNEALRTRPMKCLGWRTPGEVASALPVPAA